MKRTYYFYVFIGISLLLLTILLSSCNDKEDEPTTLDVAPFTVDIYIMDVNGTNLLNPAVPNNLCGEKISVEYEGETYPAKWPASMTRFYLAEFDGLKFVYGRDIDGFVPNNNHLEFGEFDGLKDWDLSLTLKIEERPETYLIEIIYKAWHEDGKFQSETIRKLNGVEIKGTPLIITLE